MPDSLMYHEEIDGTTGISSKTARSPTAWKVSRSERFTSDDRAFIESAPYFFLATADEQGRWIAPPRAACGLRFDHERTSRPRLSRL